MTGACLHVDHLKLVVCVMGASQVVLVVKNPPANAQAPEAPLEAQHRPPQL